MRKHGTNGVHAQIKTPVSEMPDSQAHGTTASSGERTTTTLMDMMWREMEALSDGSLSIPLANATSRKQRNLIETKKLEILGNGDNPPPLPL